MLSRGVVLLLLLLILDSGYCFAVSSSSNNKKHPVKTNLNMAQDSNTNDEQAQAQQPPEEEDNIPKLPPVSEADRAEGSSIPVLQLGDTYKLDEMGPVIINADGTTRRIANWDDMTEREREVTWRRISKRNQERVKALQEQMGALSEEEEAHKDQQAADVFKESQSNQEL